jgi:leucyl-tRNA synthetase
MSKSRGNVVPPDELVQRYGADAVRAYLMFFARWDQGGPWSSSGIDGIVRWLRRLWLAVLEPADKVGSAPAAVLRSLRRKTHQTLRQVTHDFEQYEFNTIISALMELMNEMVSAKQQGAYGTPAWDETVEIYLKMLAPVAPHITEELWALQCKPYSIHTQDWPRVDEEAAKQDEITLVLQVNGKVRDRVTVPVETGEEEAKQAALANPNVQKFLDGRTPRQVIVVRGKLVNVVV